MSKALKRKQINRIEQHKSNNDETDNSFEKVIKKVKEDRNVPKAPSPTPFHSDDEEVEVIPKKKFQNNSKKEVKVLSIINTYCFN